MNDMNAQAITETIKRIGFRIMNGEKVLDNKSINTEELLVTAAAYGLKDIEDGRITAIDDDTASRLESMLSSTGMVKPSADEIKGTITSWNGLNRTMTISFDHPVKVKCGSVQYGNIFPITATFGDLELPVDVLNIGLDDDYHIDDLYANANDNPGIAQAATGGDPNYARAELQDHRMLLSLGLFDLMKSLRVGTIVTAAGQTISNDDELRELDDFGD